ncbi:MAG: hypothetical protein HOO96_17105 [Polyangiaceae bacterium]|nr:hypothetical protein [Polyangiaceae bacterium]
MLLANRASVVAGSRFSEARDEAMATPRSKRPANVRGAARVFAMVVAAGCA